MSTNTRGLLEEAARRGDVCRVMHLLIGCEDGRGSSFLNFRFEQEGGGLNGVRRCIGPPGTLLHWAVLKDKVELATLLLSKNADVEALDDEEQTPLFAAAALAFWVGHSGMVELLLEHRAQVCPSHANGSTAVHAALTFADIAHTVGGRHVLDLLLREDPKALQRKDRRNGRTPLEEAKRAGQTGNVKFLMSEGAKRR